jgi:UDP-N-acetylmuramate dehydrogenase
MLRHDVALAEHTTLGLGGRAARFAHCQRVEQVRECLGLARQRGWPVQVLGGGSNIIFPDAGFPGLVLKVELAGVDWQQHGAWATVTAGAGEVWDELAAWCVDHHLAGVECLSGIPGLVGATPIQNVGAYGQEIRESLVSVQAVDRESLESVEFPASACAFGYRRSRFKTQDRDRYIITQVTYRLRRHGKPTIRYAELERYLTERATSKDLERGQPSLAAVRSAVLALRQSKSMLLDASDPDARSVGSFFLNPVVTAEEFARLQGRWRDIPSFPAPAGIKIPAAWLVEQAGFPKGYRHKGAGISSKHALALINCGGTTRDLLELAGMIQDGVAETLGILLEREPVVVHVDEAMWSRDL